LQEIVVRIEYKYSPNLTIIDTPGLISAAPGKKNTALQQAAKAVETMVTQKMMQQVRQKYCHELCRLQGGGYSRLRSSHLAISAIVASTSQLWCVCPAPIAVVG
jgi:hypothetical protein